MRRKAIADETGMALAVCPEKGLIGVEGSLPGGVVGPVPLLEPKTVERVGAGGTSTSTRPFEAPLGVETGKVARKTSWAEQSVGWVPRICAIGIEEVQQE